MGEVPAREVLWNITGHWLIYPCFIAALAVAVVFFVRRWRLWKIGEPENRSDRRGERLRGAVRDALLQVKVAERRGPGLVHVAMYVAMIILLIATATVAAQADLGLPLVQGDFYLYFLSLTVDIAGAAFCIAMVACIVRRIANRALDTKPGDIVVLGLLLAIGLTGFVLEGLRIAGTGDPWSAWSPVGSLFAGFFVSWDQGQIELAHRVLWWFHMALAFALIAYWTYSKLVHVLLVPAGVYWRDLKPKGELPFIDMEDEGLLSFGCGRLEELTWKDLFDTQACVRCNRCQDLCPAFATGKPLSPKSFIQDLGAELEQRGPIIYRLQKEAALEKNGAAADEGGKGAKAVPELPASEALLENADLADAERAIVDRPLVGAVIAPETLWACTTCGACMEACPAFVEHVPKVVKMRTYQVSMESAFPPEAQATFRNMENNGNPWGLGWQTRAKWAEGLDVPTIAEAPDAEYLYWPGCSGAFDARNRKVSAALVSLLAEAGVSFAILGNEEKCCGDAARRMGNEFVYFMLASENIATLQAYGVKKIIVQCPHCYQALARDYPQLGGHFEVIHHSELLARLVREGRLPRAREALGRVCFHDSCYLGRYQDIYEAPREVVRAAGGSVVEMERNRRASFCCGAGGGRMWLEESAGTRINEARCAQALDTDPDLVATSCPFCLTMLADGMVSADSDVPVRDIAELLAGAEK
ncbi:heterodisulfide reductase-related iron-sulfur binding cluster [Adlercreutzia equolifaciens]|uniref:heterodisulfide reductase-related iron-sulfur binding cluster n=1 Tax=Adlercreutzia equolifaciens TaxID=446660 RepID=UPI00399C74B6